MNEAASDQLLQEIGGKTKEVASLFEMNIGGTANYEAILKKANEALVELTLESQMQANKLQEQNQVLQKKATTDGLTGLTNRATFDEVLQQHFALAKQARSFITLLMVDVDKFKSINDRFGHQIGDKVLVALGKLLKSAAREKDLPARYGGEELVLILPDTPRSIGSAIAETIRLAVAKQPINCGTQAIPVTISIGVATYEPNCR